MFDNDRRVLARHYLEFGAAKAEIARRLKIGRRTVYNWIAEEQLGTEARQGQYGPRAARPSQLDGFKEIIAVRLAAYPQLSEVRLFDEVQAAGYTGGYDQVERHVLGVRPRQAQEPLVRFETVPASRPKRTLPNSACRGASATPCWWWCAGSRSRSPTCGVPAEVLFDQMKAVVIADRLATDGGLIEKPEFRAFSDHWGFTPHSGADRGKRLGLLWPATGSTRSRHRISVRWTGPSDPDKPLRRRARNRQNQS